MSSKPPTSGCSARQRASSVVPLRCSPPTKTSLDAPGAWAMALALHDVSSQPLRILGVGNVRSINFIRWAQRLAERGHEVVVTGDRPIERAEDLEGVNVVRSGSSPGWRRCAGRARSSTRGRSGTPPTGTHRPRPRAPALPLRRRRGDGRHPPVRPQPLGHRHARPGAQRPPGRQGAPGDRGRRLARAQLGRQRAGLPRAGRAAREHPAHHLVRGARQLRAGARPTRPSAAGSGGPTTRSSSSPRGHCGPTPTST